MHASSQCRCRSDDSFIGIPANGLGQLPIRLAPVREPMEAGVDRVLVNVGGRMRASSWVIGLLLTFSAASASAKNDDLYDRKIDAYRAYSPNPPPPAREPTELSARRDGLGAIVTGFGGLATADSRLHEGAGVDAPDALRDARLGIEGERAVGGFASDLLVRISDVRFGFGSVLAFGDSFRLDAPPLANGFTVQPGST